MHPWIPVIVTVVLGLFGLGIQGLLLAYFVGRMKENQVGQAQLVSTFQEFTRETLSSLLGRLGEVDKTLFSAGTDRANIAARLQAVESNTAGLQEERQTFAAFRATAEAHQSRVESELGRILQAQEGQQRQLANLALRGTGSVLELGVARDASKP